MLSYDNYVDEAKNYLMKLKEGETLDSSSKLRKC